ncbi:MAG TPA: Hpt domain-containing protein [Accumulibacter sp.]|uniref:Hpt domain-containing protein n=1 Tax=Accumulibacter sp. TaxID=2053492 RepID=UPI002B51AD34|nr:Hpt domain-containing protein [Accumulibacter sp.]HRD90574.1 Hpt domain-containing protein [Accumulibacter sp.]
MRKTAHALKSSSANVGAEPLAALCKALEMLGRQESVDGASVLLAAAETELTRVLAALREQRGRKAENALAAQEL